MTMLRDAQKQIIEAALGLQSARMRAEQPNATPSARVEAEAFEEMLDTAIGRYTVERQRGAT